MNLVVVADTSPVNYLLETGYIDILPGLYGHVIIPATVHRELLSRGSSERLREWASALPGWVSIQSPLKSPELTRGLHRGEMDAIALAEQLQAGLILMDDSAGVRYALRRGLSIAGTLAVLVEAAQNGRLQIDEALSKLEKTDFRATPALYERARQLANTIPPVLPRRHGEGAN